MKRLLALMVMIMFLSVTGIAGAVDKTATFTWEQDCINGCTVAVDGIDRAPVITWKIYMGDTPGVYDPTPLAEIVFNGTVNQNYTSDVVLTLTGMGTKYFVITSNNPDGDPPESGYSNEANYPYDFRGTATPVTFTFTIQSP